MFEKPITYWFAIVGVSLWLMGRDAETEGLSRRVVKTIASALMAIGLTKDISEWLGFSETIAAVMIMAFGLMILDLATALIADRTFIKDIIKNRIGRG